MKGEEGTFNTANTLALKHCDSKFVVLKLELVSIIHSYKLD